MSNKRKPFPRKCGVREKRPAGNFCQKVWSTGERIAVGDSLAHLQKLLARNATQ